MDITPIVLPRDNDIRYLKRLIRKNLVLLLGPRGIGKSWLIKRLLKENIINEVFDFKLEVFRGFRSYHDILESIIETKGVIGIDHIEILPREYRYGSITNKVLSRMESGGIIATHWRGIISLLKKFDIDYTIYMLSEIPLKLVYKALVKAYEDVEPEVLWKFVGLFEGYPSAIIYTLLKSNLNDILYFDNGMWMLRWSVIHDIDYLYKTYPELYNIKRELDLHNLLRLASWSRPNTIMSSIGPKTNVYLSRLYNAGILDRIKTINGTYYYIRDPFARLLLSYTEPKDISLENIKSYIGVNFLIIQLMHTAQGQRIKDVFGKELFIGNISQYDIDDDIITLFGNMKVAIKVHLGPYRKPPIEDLYNTKADARLLFLIGSEFKGRDLADIHIFDDSIIGFLSARLGFERIIS